MIDITIEDLFSQINKTDESRIIYVQCFYNNYNISYRIMSGNRVYRYLVTDKNMRIDQIVMKDLESEISSLWNIIERLKIKTADKIRKIYTNTKNI